jgi:hypothetical protein
MSTPYRIGRSWTTVLMTAKKPETTHAMHLNQEFSTDATRYAKHKKRSERKQETKTSINSLASRRMRRKYFD